MTSQIPTKIDSAGNIARFTSGDYLPADYLGNISLTTVHGSVSGSIKWGMVLQGTLLKLVMIGLDAYDNVGSTVITFPTAFNFLPCVIGLNGPITISGLTKTTVTIPALSGVDGTVIIQGM